MKKGLENIKTQSLVSLRMCLQKGRGQRFEVIASGRAKAENDLGNRHPSPPRKSYNPFDSDDDALDSPGLKSENMYAKENLNGFDLKAFEKSSDTVIFHMDNGEFLWEEDVPGEPKIDDHAVNVNSNVNSVLFGKEGQPYTDKNVTECELPEFVICYKESNIKDIGIDVGVPSNEKLWVQSGEDDDKNSSAFLNKTDIDMKVEESNDKLEAPKSTLDSEWQKDITALNSSGNQAKLDGLNEEALTGKYLVHEFVDTDLLKITELKLDVEDRVLPVFETAKGGLVADVAHHHHHHPTTEKETEMILSGHDDSLEKKSHETSQGVVDNVAVIHESATTQSPSELLTESPNKEETLPNSSSDASMEDSANAHDPNKLPYNSKVETRTITFDFRSSKNSKPEKQEDEPEKTDVPIPPASQTMTRQEEVEEEEEEKQKEGEIPSSSILHARLEQRVHGETSFSAGMPVPLPSLIAFSEPLTYSGSLSLRSESSAGTTSTRSFAFPVLQTEWNSSPPKMGKAGQRHMKKHRGWVKTFSCCKF
ncbi:hypothetical protein V2J09_012928 [Rumex salicifolius]